VSGFDTAKLFTFAWRNAGRLPGPVLRGLCNAGADVAWLRHGGGVRQLERNLQRVRPTASRRALRRLSRAGMRSYMRYYGEAFALASLTPDQVTARVRTVGEENLRPHLDAGRTVLLALGHLGNWDLAGAYAAAHIAPVTSVAERLKPEELFLEFVAFRESLGMTVIPLTGGGDVFRDLMRTLRTGPGLLPLLADRDLTARGVEVDLFGHRARVAAGPAALAVSTGAALSPTIITYERLHGERRRRAGSPWGIVIDFGRTVQAPTDVPRADRVRDLTQRWVDAIGAGIAAQPEDWHMMQKVFVADLDPSRYAETVAAVGVTEGGVP
jgi:lauroyl/myristoyl acyltransferase